MKDRKGFSGITAMILLVGILVLTALIAGLILDSSNMFRTKAEQGADKTEDSLSGHIYVTELMSEYQDKRLLNITSLIKLSDDTTNYMDLNDLTISVQTETGTARLEYGGMNRSHGAGGFYTLGIEHYEKIPTETKDDLDEDNDSDYLYNRSGELRLNLSSHEDMLLGRCSGNNFDSSLSDNAYVDSVDASCQGGHPVSAKLTASQLGDGHFTVSYAKKGSRHRPDHITSGDMVRLHFELLTPLGTNKEGTIRLIPKSGKTTTQMFVTPHQPGRGRVSLSHY